MLEALLLLAKVCTVSNRVSLLKSGARAPLIALGRGPQSLALHIAIQLINLLKRQAFGLVDKEINKRYADEAAAEPDEEDLGLQVGVAWTVVDEVRGCVGDCPVEKPLQEASAQLAES